MSRLTDLIAQLEESNADLAADLRREIAVLSRRRPYGLNFERHVPESVQLPQRRIRRGDKVIFRPSGDESGQTADGRIWVVTGIDGRGEERVARLTLRGPGAEVQSTTGLVSELVVVAEFRDPIYPGLRATGSVERGGDRPYHTVINGENFHVLEALTFVCSGQVDCIYIDPPYNSGARDWKYNNDYVDAEDDYRHSKWLAMMERRLLLARELLNPAGSVLIVTIDEREIHRLGLLLEQVFTGDIHQMVTTVVNRKGVPRRHEFARVEEYLLFVFVGDSGPDLRWHDMLSDGQPTQGKKVEWVGLRRRGSEWRRQDREGSFYPIFVDRLTGRIVDVGQALALELDRHTVSDRAGLLTVWPLNRNGEESRWQLAPANVMELVGRGYVRSYLQRNGRGVTIEYLSDGQRRQIEEGAIVVTGRDDNGGMIVEHAVGRMQQPKSVWNVDSHGATAYGTQLLSSFLPGRRFPYPKSLYAVEDALRFFVGDKPEALILDFFAGSGTTAHAVMRLNHQDGGQRRCILVTNNEVSSDEAARLRRRGLRPGDPEWEAQGIALHITNPRVTAAIEGKTSDGEPIRGDYKFIDGFPMAAGFEENAEFFDLSYEDPEVVGHGLGFAAVAPLLWLRAGAEGRRIVTASDTFEVADTYAILFSLDASAAFVAATRASAGLRIGYIVTDDEAQFQVVAAQLPSSVEPIRLYSAYLDNFKIAPSH